MPWIWHATSSGQGCSGSGLPLVQEQQAVGAGPGAREVVGEPAAEAEAGEHVRAWGRVGGGRGGAEHLLEAERVAVGDAGVEVVEDGALVEVGRVDGVPGGAQLGGERVDAGAQPQRGVQQQDLGHCA
jgi:hypothetical protein